MAAVGCLKGPFLHWLEYKGGDLWKISDTKISDTEEKNQKSVSEEPARLAESSLVMESRDRLRSENSRVFPWVWNCPKGNGRLWRVLVWHVGSQKITVVWIKPAFIKERIWEAGGDQLETWCNSSERQGGPQWRLRARKFIEGLLSPRHLPTIRSYTSE